MTFHTYTTPPFQRTKRAWGARTEDRFYVLDVEVDPVGCSEPPPWLLFEFYGKGELTTLDCWAGVVGGLTQFVCRLAPDAPWLMREVDRDEFTRVADEAQADAIREES